MSKIGLLGSGPVSRVLASGFTAHGYEVQVGSRSAGKLADFSAKTGIHTGTFTDVVEWADVLVLAVLGRAALEALSLAGESRLRGKIIIDTTNPISDAPPVDGVLQFFTGPNSSLMEQLQSAFPEARFVKAFNSVGSARMVNPAFSAGPPSMFFCGNDTEAKSVVADILTQFGWEPVDLGTAAAARAIEPLCQLWCIPGFRQNHWSHAFRVLWS
jgi:predicted dinucleotide-binding enzyme